MNKIFRIFLLIFFLQTSILLNSQPNADFTFSPNNVCAGTVISFVNNSTGDSFHWNFGDGNTSNEENPTHTFFPASGDGSQNFSVTLTAYQGDDEDSQTETVSVLRPPGTELIDPYNWPSFAKCTGNGDFELTVENNSNSTNTNYVIEWGDGSPDFVTGDFETATNNYSSPGLYELIFTVTGENGCIASDTIDILYGANPGLGIVGPEGSVGCAPVDLTYEITGVAGNIGTNYMFQFDDGSDPYIFTQDDIPNSITHMFTDASCIQSDDNFRLVGYAENQCGYQQVTIEPIRVDREPIARIQLDTNIVCVNEPITFHNNSEPVCGGNPNLTQYTWYFDGEEHSVGNSNASQTHVFDNPGDKTITLEALNTSVTCNGGFSSFDTIITVLGDDQLDTPADWLITGDDTGCQGAEFTFSIPAVDNATYYDWILPDGAEIIDGEGTNEITVIFGTKTTKGEVEITVIAGNECSVSEESETFNFTILPLPGPISEIQGLDHFCEGSEHIENYSIDPLEVSGDITWQVPAGATINSGQGTTEIEVHFSPTFESGVISVAAENACGETEPTELLVLLLDLPHDASGLEGPDYVCQNDSVTFYVPEITYANSYRWFLNDNELIESEQSEITLFMDGEPGEHTVSVLGVNDCGEGQIDEHIIIIKAIPEPEFAPQDHCFGYVAHFTDGAAIDSNIEQFYWSFGDGYSSTLPEPVHIYDTIGEFEVTLEVTSFDGCMAFVTDTIQVYDIPYSRFYANPDTVFIGQSVQFVDESYLHHDTLKYASYWFYDFGDDTEREFVQHPTKAYNETGKYTVMQIVDIDNPDIEFGCPDTSYVDVLVVKDFYIPNAFMPGGGSGSGDDGIMFFGPVMGGDGFPPGDDGYEIELEFSIYNRWGEQIYYEKGLEPKWDGTIRSGPIAPQGVYVWRLMYKDREGKPIVKTGSVLLLK